MKISWSKEQRERAKTDGVGLFAAGADYSGGKWLMHCPMNHDMCEKAMVFLTVFYKSKNPVEAFKKAWPDLWPVVNSQSPLDSCSTTGNGEAE